MQKSKFEEAIPMLKDEYKVYEEKMRKSIDSVAADFFFSST